VFKEERGMASKWFFRAAITVAWWVALAAAKVGAQEVGYTAGEFSVDPTGAATYRIPLEVPPGTAGMRPDLALLYHSRAGNGQLGVGWSVSGLSTIARCPALLDQEGETRAGGVTLSGSDRFCLDGQPLRHQGGTYGAGGTEYFTEIQSFQAVTSHGSTSGAPTHFTVTDRAGLTRYYGQTSDSRITSVGGISGRPLVWAINRIEDKHGNYIAFSYGRDATVGEYWPTEIRWANRDGMILGRVQFSYTTTRPDTHFGYGYGRTRHSLTRRLAHIQVNEGLGNAVRRYTLAYQQGRLNNLSYLASVRECAGTGSPCLPATTFSWTQGEQGYDLALPGTAANHASNIKWLDANGDGRLDAVIRANGTIYIYFATRRGTAVTSSVPAGSHLRFDEAVVLDYNGDGRMDLLVANTSSGHWDVYQSTGTNFTYIQTGRPHYGAHTKHPVAIDLSGNGVPELVFKRAGRLYVYLGANDGGFGLTPVLTDWIASDGQKLMPMQFDGDGRPELFVSFDDCTFSSGGGEGGGGGEEPPMDLHSLPGDSLVTADLGGEPNDTFNQDIASNGLDDFDGTASTQATSSGTCADTAGPLKWDAVNLRFHRPWSDPGSRHFRDVRLLDFDGDGLTDVVFVNWFNGALEVALNRGGHLQHAWSGLNNTGWNKSMVVDWNHDGRDDLLVRGANNQFVALTYRDNYFQVLSTGVSAAHAAYVAGDWNGTGQADIHYLSSGTWRVWQQLGQKAGHLLRVTNGLGDTLAIGYGSIAVGYGAAQSLYRGHEASDAGVAKPRVSDFLGPLYVVASYAADSGTNSSTGQPQKVVTRYQYAGAKLNRQGRGFLGFRRVLAHNLNTDIVTENIHFQEFPYTGRVARATQRMPDTITVSVGQPGWDDWFQEHCSHPDEEGCQGPPPPAIVTHPGPVVSDTEFTVAQHLLGSSGAGRVRFPYLQDSVETERELSSGQVVRRTTTSYTYDTDGHATQVSVTTDDGAGGDAHTVTTVNTWHHTVACPSRLARSVVTQSVPAATAHGPASRARTATFQYDPVHCQLTQEVSHAGTSAALTTSHAYDAFGNRTQETVSGAGLTPRTTTTTWDAQGRFPVSITNALGHSASSTWDARFGRRLTTTDANGLVLRWTYDAFGRETQVTGPRSTQQVTTSRARCGVSGCQHPEAVLKITRTGSGSASEQSLAVTELDRLGREVAAGEKNVLGQVVYALTYFDTAGRPYASSGPYRPGIDTGACWTLRHYDPLGRARSEYASAQPAHCGSLAPPASGATPPGWSVTQTQYAGLTTTVIDPEGRQRQRIVNVMDRLRFVREHDGSAWQQTEYRYDGHGNTTRVQAPGGVLTTSTYDDAGRKTAMSDPSMGAWSYTYTVAGELTSQADAKGVTVTMTYDALGRLLTRTEPEGTTTWSYDQVAHGAARGQVTNITGPHGYQERFWYQGAGGELSASARYIGDTWFWTHFDYNGLGQVSRIRYPSVNCAAPCSSVPPDSGRLRVDQFYRHGHLVQVRERQPNEVAGTIYWEALEVDALGSVTRERLGNNLETLRYVNPATGLVESLVTGGANQPTAVQDLGMAWDRVGNLVQRADYRVNRREDLAYDGLGRLTSVTLRTAAGGLLGTEAVHYGPSGNLLAKGGFTNYQYGHAGRPHQVSAVTTPAGTRGYQYDAKGNLTQVTGPGARTVTWWSFNKPRRMERDANNHSEYWYGPAGDRAMFRQSARINGQLELTLYGAAFYERRHIGAAVEHTHYVQANGGTVAVVKRSGTSVTNTTRYLHKDHLGSVVAITNDSGAIVESLAYDAWGKRRPATTWQTPGPGVFIAAMTLTRGFTMHEHRDHVGLIHMGGRMYDPELGRFLSPDPFVQFPASTQGFNRYAYVSNNPLSYTDPSGYFLKKALKIGLSVAVAYYTGGWANEVFRNASIGGALGGAVGGYLATGTTQGAMLGALSGGVAGGIGGIKGIDELTRGMMHGVTQGAISKAGGGRFGDGALGAFTSSVGGGQLRRLGPGLGQAMAAAVVGGTASVIGGGKFANGAIAAAWVNLFNHQSPSRFRFQDSIDAIEGMDVSEREKGKIFQKLNLAVMENRDWLYKMSSEELGDFFGRLPSDRAIYLYRDQFAADLGKLQVYAARRATGTLARDAYGAANIAAPLGSATSPAARGVGAFLQALSIHQMFSPTNYNVTFTCAGHPLTTCRTQVSR
jgi:RHS repeat-associated protein